MLTLEKERKIRALIASGDSAKGYSRIDMLSDLLEQIELQKKAISDLKHHNYQVEYHSSSAAASRILKHFGPDNQKIKAMEECSELIQALCKNMIKKEEDQKDINVQEELADCFVMLYQLREHFGSYSVDDWVAKKIHRILKRMDENI